MSQEMGGDRGRKPVGAVASRNRPVQDFDRSEEREGTSDATGMHAGRGGDQPRTVIACRRESGSSSSSPKQWW